MQEVLSVTFCVSQQTSPSNPFTSLYQRHVASCPLPGAALHGLFTANIQVTRTDQVTFNYEAVQQVELGEGCVFVAM